MTSKYAGGPSLCAGLVAAIGIVGMAVTPATAQQADEEAIEEIVVEAPLVRRQVVGRTAIGGKMELIELTRRVSFADLDLGKRSDVTELEARIETVAKESCEKIDEMFPLTMTSGKDEVRRCTKKAIKGTEEQLEAAIAAAAPAS